MKPLPIALTLAGTLPFIAATVSLAVGKPLHPTVSVVMLITYAAVILSFLGGIHWGLALKLMDDAPTSAARLFALSVVPALVAWALLFLVPDPQWQFAGMLIVLSAVWAIDGLLRVQNIIPQAFFRLRSIATAIVGLCLLVSWWVLPR